MQKFPALPILILFAAWFSLWPASTVAQDFEASPVHWAYSAYFGTGWYRVAGDRDVFVARMTPRWTRSEPQLLADGSRKIGIYLKFPVSVGLENFDYDDVLEAVDIDNVSYLSVNPGIDIEIPINEVWSLRPYAALGHGQVFGSGESAWTYWAGLKSKLEFSAGRVDWRLLNLLGYVGYTPDVGPDDSFTPLMVGIELDFPLASANDASEKRLLHWYTNYTVFGNDLEFTGGNTMITDQWEFGAAIGNQGSPIRIWFLEFDWLGLGYRASSNGELRGVTFVFRSLFDE